GLAFHPNLHQFCLFHYLAGIERQVFVRSLKIILHL
ncbi:MAG: hypothetical protein ACI97P_000767, partial [Arcticibacterium sp.]